jgi:hypothetical protein
LLPKRYASQTSLSKVDRMKARLTILLSALALAACSTTGGGSGGIDVTRFHLNQPTARGAIYVEPARMADGGSLEFRTYADAVAAELRAAGFTPVPALAQAEFTASVDFTRETRQGIDGGRPPVTIGIGGASFGRRSSLGLGTSFGIGKKRSSDTAIETLALALKRRSDASVVWEGRAVIEARAGSDAAERDVVPRLARALLSGYPGPSGKTVRIQG